MDLSKLALACDWLGLPATESLGGPHDEPGIRIGAIGGSVWWDGVKADWAVTGAIMDAILEWWIRQPVNYRCKSWKKGKCFLTTDAYLLTTTLAATALLEMFDAAEGKG